MAGNQSVREEKWKELLPEKKDREWADYLKPGDGVFLLIFFGVERTAIFPLWLGFGSWLMKALPDISLMVLIVVLIPIILFGFLCWHCWTKESAAMWVCINLGLIAFGLAVSSGNLLAILGI